MKRELLVHISSLLRHTTNILNMSGQTTSRADNAVVLISNYGNHSGSRESIERQE